MADDNIIGEVTLYLNPTKSRKRQKSRQGGISRQTFTTFKITGPTLFYIKASVVTRALSKNAWDSHSSLTFKDLYVRAVTPLSTYPYAIDDVNDLNNLKILRHVAVSSLAYPPLIFTYHKSSRSSARSDRVSVTSTTASAAPEF